MRIYHYTILFTALVFSACDTNGQRVDNTKPMYGEVTKSEDYKKIDEEFRKNCLEQFKTIDSAVFVQIDNAWRYFYHNDLKTAMKRFNQAWLLNPEYPDSYFGFAALVQLQGDSGQAKRFYTLGIAKDKNSERAKICYQRIADCKEQLNDIQGTIEAYSKIAEIDPENSFAFKKIGYFQMNAQNLEAAIEAFAQAIKLDPNDAPTYNNRGYLYQMMKDYPSATLDYTKAIELDPQYISAYVNRGMTSMFAGKMQEAKKDFEICVKLDSKAGELRRFLGMSEIGLGDKSGACKDFLLAKQLGDLKADELIIKNCK
jgi:tetratricopeptide (TPR) repeat protein